MVDYIVECHWIHTSPPYAGMDGMLFFLATALVGEYEAYLKALTKWYYCSIFQNGENGVQRGELPFDRRRARL